jgi:predicted metalloendopeptidase
VRILWQLHGKQSKKCDGLLLLQMWCRAETLAGLETMLQRDSHSPNRFRVIGSLSNMAEFSEAFGCQLGSRMNPVHKCVLW